MWVYSFRNCFSIGVADFFSKMFVTIVLLFAMIEFVVGAEMPTPPTPPTPPTSPPIGGWNVSEANQCQFVARNTQQHCQYQYMEYCGKLIRMFNVTTQVLFVCL
jgi:hypothetical protein